jgi:small basic protein
MMFVIPLLALLLGFFAAFFGDVFIPNYWSPYLSLATIAGMDSVFGGIRSGLEGKFHTSVFISGFIANTLFAAFLAWLGDAIAVDLYLAAAVALGSRILLNLSLVRRYYINRYETAQAKKASAVQSLPETI